MTTSTIELIARHMLLIFLLYGLEMKIIRVFITQSIELNMYELECSNY